MVTDRLHEEAALYGVDTLSDEQLLAMLIGARTAAAVLASCEDLLAVSRAGRRTLQRIPGIGPVTAGQIQAALELGRRLACPSVDRLGRLMGSEDVARFFSPRLVHLDHEQLWVATLDCRNRVIGVRMIARGGLTGLSVTPREVLVPAIVDRAAGLILAHNHPSGDPTPSQVDRDLTDRVARTAKLLGIELLDHVIVAAAGGHSSICCG